MQSFSSSTNRNTEAHQTYPQPVPVNHTHAHKKCPACEEARRTMLTSSNVHAMPFSAAAEVWLDRHRDSIGERTYKDYCFYIRTLSKFFGEMTLAQIHIGNLLEYRRMRQQTAGPWCINHEITTLKQILQMADLWDLIGKHYKPLRLPNWTPPKVLTVEEEEKFFRVAAANPSWAVAYRAAALSTNTSAIGAELRYLQLQHLYTDRTPPVIHIADLKAKNEFRARIVPLNQDAQRHVGWLLTRAQRLGAYKPEHYLFPFRVKKGSYDVTRPASAFFIRSAFRSMRKATGLNWLQPRNFRNQLITKLFESGAADETIISIAGHASIRMSRYYSRIRITAKAEALDRIGPKSSPVQKVVENVG